MTTINEYKSLMEGATDALNAKPAFLVGGIAVMANGVGEKINQLNKASREIAPSLILVIELAEEALLYTRNTCKLCDNAPQDIFDKACDLSDNALSEIRKLRGE